VVNWGAAIILLTLFVKICFFPLTQKAFISSRKMQAVQPKMKAMQEKYKDNKEVLQQEMMKFYKSEGVNPLGGCLPTLIQMPVWFALYTVFLNSFDLYDSSFLYLKDLTAADPYAILPVLYMGLMFLNTKLMPMPDMSTMDEKAKEMAQMQRKMFKIMPLAFGIFMFNFPSGLVVYFCVNISLSILQLWMINRKFETAQAGA
jgi:YidC/Oxa1 family membrane protein insertase